MSNQELAKYIKESLAKNIPVEQIKANLLAAGWKQDDIILALQEADFAKEIVNTVKPSNQPKEEIETKITGKIFAIVGILALLFGLSFFFKYIFERHLISDTLKVLIGIVSGLIFLIIGHILQQKEKYRQYSFIVSGGGLAILYLSVYGAFNYYHLIGQPVAFGSMIIITIIGMIIAFKADSEILAVISSLGGFLTPYLVSTGVDNQFVLFTYILILNLGFLSSIYFKKWRHLYLLNFIGTYIIFFGWFFKFYNNSKLLPTFVFLSLFFLVFFVTPFFLSFFQNKKSDERDLIISVFNTAVYFGVGYYILKPDYQDLAGLFFALGSIFYLLSAYFINNINEEDKSTITILTGMGLILAVLAVPIQFDDYQVAIGWAIEGLFIILGGFWFANFYIRYFGLVVFMLTIGQLNKSHIAINIKDFTLFLNERFIAFAIAAVCIFCAAYLYNLYKDNLDTKRKEHYVAAGLGLIANMLMIIIFSLEALSFFDKKISEFKVVYPTLTGTDYYSKIKSLNNFKNLSLSIIWVVYAGVLMIAGILKNYKSARLLSLAIFGVTIVKVFIYDIARLSELYRIASFISLGTILLIVSFLFYRYKEKIKAFLIE